jgi:hypothetical protein
VVGVPPLERQDASRLRGYDDCTVIVSAVDAPHPNGRDIEFFLIAESGILEAQALLLCASIRKYAGACSSAAITVASPRPDRRPSPATVRALNMLGAEYLALDMASPCPMYGPSFKVLVAGHIARRPGPPVVVQLDSDTLFLGEPDFSLPDADAAARPVGVKGMCTAGEGDPFDPYWRELCRLCEVDYGGIPFVVSTVDRQRVRASYNGGLVAARRASGIFQRTELFFRRLAAAGLKPHASFSLQTGTGVVDGVAGQYWGTSQAALSLAATATGHRVRILPPSYNVPFHMLSRGGDLVPVHVHYHHWLSQPRAVSDNPLLDGRVPLPEETVAWLRERLPLKAAAEAGS